jgi:hypothetical protein
MVVASIRGAGESSPLADRWGCDEGQSALTPLVWRVKKAFQANPSPLGR